MSLEVVVSEREYEQRVNAMAPPFIYLHDGLSCRVESTPVALTACSISGTGLGWFQLRIPKIPQYVLKALYLFFEQVADNYETEVRVQVYFNSETREFELDFPEQEVTSASVYTLDAEYGLMTDTVWPVLDMHSHCRFPAMFSATDNRNEKGNWVFGVIGSLGPHLLRSPELVLRVGTGGNFMKINADEVFDFTITDDLRAERMAKDLFEQTDEKLHLAG